MKLNNLGKKKELTISPQDSSVVELDVTTILEQLGIDSSNWTRMSLQPNNSTQNKTKP